MKKLLGLTALAALLVLAACGGDSGGDSDESTTCTLEEMGMEMEITAHAEDGNVTTIDVDARLALSDLGLTADDLEGDLLNDMSGLLGVDGNASVDGDYLVITASDLTPEEFGTSSTLEEFVADAEEMGGTCS